jgi:hypothetical protein
LYFSIEGLGARKGSDVTQVRQQGKRGLTPFGAQQQGFHIFIFGIGEVDYHIRKQKHRILRSLKITGEKIAAEIIISCSRALSFGRRFLCTDGNNRQH